MAMGKIMHSIRVDEVVPHRRPMSLLRHVIAHDRRSTVCDIQIGRETLFLTGKRVESWVGLEYMAQAVAAHAGMVGRRQRKPVKIGFLLGTRLIDFFTDGFVLGQTLHVLARHVWGEGELFSFDCTITDAVDGRRLAAAQLNVFRPADPDSFFEKGTL
jgi:predicted hotdog family 3-hydroxylacyl-ACP dehydratase